MDIIRILTRGGQDFAVEMADCGETYNVLLEALGNSVIFPELMKSGWELAALPLELIKDGIALKDLPRMEYSPSLEEEMDMIDRIGTEVPIQDRKRFLSKHHLATVKMEEGKYSIQTREELLAFLDAQATTQLSENFLPINYITHPNALFSWDEFRDPKNSRWVSLIERRRHFTYPQFTNLRTWALQNGLSEDFSEQDFVSFYFQWGICGLRLQVLSKQSELWSVRHDASVNVAMTPEERMPKLTEFGLIDCQQNTYQPEGTQGYSIMDTTSALRISRTLSGREAAVIRLRKPYREPVEIWKAVETDVSFNQRSLMIGGKPYTSIQVQGLCGYLHPKFWNPLATVQMKEDMYLRAIAKSVIAKRIRRTDASSYRALCESGCSPFSALVYMVKSLRLDSPAPLEDAPVIAVRDIMRYLSNEEVLPEIATVLSSIMDGAQNIDLLAEGMLQDAAHNTDNLYLQLYCIHTVLGVSVRDIYTKLDNFTPGEDVVFSNDAVQVTISTAPIDAAHRGYLQDKAEYRRKQAEESIHHFWVDRAARELGPEDARRHVAVRGYIAPATERMRSGYEMQLRTLQEEFETFIGETFGDPRQCAKYTKVSRIFAINAFFSGALQGFYTYPKELNHPLVCISTETKSAWRSFIRGPVVEDTVSMSDDIAAGGGPDDGWTRYTVNAVITPYEVTPRYGFTLLETSLAAVWKPTNGLDIFPELVKRGLISPTDEAWGSLYQRGDTVFAEHTDDRSLVNYYNNAAHFRATYDKSKQFTAAPHPLELHYPRFALEDTVLPLVEEGSTHAFRVGKYRLLKFEKAQGPLESTSTSKVAVSLFQELTAEDFFYTNGDVVFPASRGKTPMAVTPAGQIVTEGRLLQPQDVEQLDESRYPVAQLCGRRYILCDVSGMYWVVEV